MRDFLQAWSCDPSNSWLKREAPVPAPLPAQWMPLPVHYPQPPRPKPARSHAGKRTAK